MPNTEHDLHQPSMPEASLPIEQTPGLLNKLRLGRLGVLCAGVEVPAIVASIITKDLFYVEMGTYFNAVAAGVSAYGAHQYFRNDDRSGKDSLLIGAFIKDKSTDTGNN